VILVTSFLVVLCDDSFQVEVAPISAVVVPIVPAIDLKRVLFTTDFTDASQRALPILAAIARRYGSKVYAAHVWTPNPYAMVSPEVIDVLDRQSKRAAKAELAECPVLTHHGAY